jgi:GxxExxY protein
MTENEIAKELMDIFFKVHKSLGPGLLESVYEAAICYELELKELQYSRQKGIGVYYNEVKLDLGFRADIIVENKVIVEVKSVDGMAPVFFKTLLTYLRLADKKLGFQVNFNVPLVKDGILRVANNL